MYSFEDARKQWGSPPVEGRGYIPSKEALSQTDDHLRQWYKNAAAKRYVSWRGDYAAALGLDTLHGKILDYGCGFGTDSLRLALAGNEITLADINSDNTEAAARIHRAHGFDVAVATIFPDSPFIHGQIDADIFFSAGVMHHFPYADDVMRWACPLFERAILLVYSDRLWRDRTGAHMIGLDENVADHPKHEVFVRSVDGVGNYAEPYDVDRIHHRLAVDDWRVTDLAPVGDSCEFWAVHMDQG